MPWNRDILQLLREVRFSLVRFEEDESPEDLQEACNMLANIAEEIGTEVVDEEPKSPDAN